MERKPSAILIHASIFFAPFIVPIIFMLITNDRYIKDLAIEALLFHVLVTVGLTVSGFLVVILIGIPLLAIVGLVGLYFPIKGIVGAVNDKPFHYPFVSQWVR